MSRRADRTHLREMRPADGAARGPARSVPGLHRLSQVQERQGRRCRGQPGQADDTGIACEKCGSPMAVKQGFRGPFLGCSAYPKCRSTKPLPAEMKEKLKDMHPGSRRKKTSRMCKIDDTCPECGGPMKLRQGARQLLPRLCQISQVQGHARSLAGATRTITGNRGCAVMNPSRGLANRGLANPRPAASGSRSRIQAVDG